MKKKLLTGLILICSVAICFAATFDINGKWKAVMQMIDGNEIALNYDFKVDGDKLTGNIEASGNDLTIDEGKIKGDSIFFSVSFNGGAIPSKGRCYKDSIAMNTILGDVAYHVVLTRAK